jgi:hypothetical protein
MSAVSRIVRSARVIRPRVAIQARALSTSVRPVARVARVAGPAALPAQRRWESTEAPASTEPVKLGYKLSDNDKKKLARQRNIGM